MPIELERKLQAVARKRWPDDKDRQNRYVYGTLRKSRRKSERKSGNPVSKVTRKLSRSWTTPAR